MEKDDRDKQMLGLKSSDKLYGEYLIQAEAPIDVNRPPILTQPVGGGGSNVIKQQILVVDSFYREPLKFQVEKVVEKVAT